MPTEETPHLISPHGGELVNLFAAAERIAEIKNISRSWPSWDLTPRQICDLELLLTGGFSPLRSFMSRQDYESCCSCSRLEDGTLWPIPITLDVTENFVESAPPGASVALRDPEGVMLAALHVDHVWQPDLKQEAQAVFGTTNLAHPGVEYLLEQANPWYMSGTLEGLQPPSHYDFRNLRLTPAELRHEFTSIGWRKVVAFQTRSPMHRVHYELTLRAAKQAEASLLIHPTVGITKPADVEYYVRVRCYQALLPRYLAGTVKLALLPLATRMGGPREALWHAIIRKNYACSHFIVGPDHAGGEPFYGPYDAQEFLKVHETELGVQIIAFRNLVYSKDEDRFVPEDEIPSGAQSMSLSGTDLRGRLNEGRQIPAWFTFPEVAHELQRASPPRHRQGFTLFFTGLSGSGKSTIANILQVRFLEMGGRPVTLLDGDLVRKHLSSELGFSKEHRDINVRRIGFVASQITKNGGIAICAPIAPYESIRKEVQAMIEPYGAFVLVYLKPPLEVCEARDRKGLYAKARAGVLQHFTGISDPYEAPLNADVVIDTSQFKPEEAAQQIFLHLEAQELIGANRDNAA